jgi:hypothetical protein
MNTLKWLWTAPEHTLSAHECQWVTGSSPWTPLSVCECVNMIEWFLNATHRGVTIRKKTFVWELNSPWMQLSVCECLWLSFNTPWMLLNVHEHLWMSIEHHLHAIEYTWMPLRSLNNACTPIECLWMMWERFLDGLNVHMYVSKFKDLWGSFILRVWTLESIDIM